MRSQLRSHSLLTTNPHQLQVKTKEFHVTASSRKKKNTISCLEINGVMVYNQSILLRHITDYYKGLMGSSSTRIVSLQENLWSASDNLTLEQCISLESPFTLDEIKRVVF